MLLQGKRALVLGVANKRSIAWAIAQSLQREGAELALTFQGERVEPTVRDLAASVGSDFVLPCDVQSEEQLDTLFGALADRWGRLDVLVHSLAFTPHEELENRYVESKRENWLLTMDVSAYSLVAVTRRAEPLMREHGGSIITMTYNGSQRATPHYNTMGVAKAALESSVRYLAAELGQSKIRVNAISAGPLRTLAARSITGFAEMEDVFRKNNALRRSLEQSEVGDTAAFLASDWSRGTTGTIIFVDAGWHIL